MSADGAVSTLANRPSAWRRAMATPILDLLCGRIWGGRAITQLIVNSGLSRDICEVIVRVLLKAQLWPREERQVAGELIAHFTDGLAAGHSAESLIELFGDPDVAAKLIRKSKLHLRPWWWHLRVWTERTIVILLAVFIVGDVSLLLYTKLGRPMPSAQPLHAIVASWPHDQQARDAWALLTEAEAGMEGWSKLADRSSFSRDQSTQWAAQSHFLQTHQRELALMRQAALAPAIEIPVEFPENDPAAGLVWTYQTMSPLWEKVWELRFRLRLDARRAAEAGDGATAIANIEALLELDKHLDAHIRRTLDANSVTVASEIIQEVLRQQPQLWNDAQLHALARRLSNAQTNYRTNVQQFRQLFDYSLSCVYTRGGKITDEGFLQVAPPIAMDWGAGSTFEAKLADGVMRVLMYFIYEPTLTALLASSTDQRREFERRLALILDMESKPPWEINEWDANTIDHFGDWEFIRHMPVRSFLHNAAGSRLYHSIRTTAQRNATLTAIALVLYRRQHGNWPATLDELIPQFLSESPPDACTGKPLGYRNTDDHTLLYSWGRDNDDDHGNPTTEQWGWIPPLGDGDWILWTSQMHDPVSPQH